MCDATCISCRAFDDLRKFEAGLEELNDDAKPGMLACCELYSQWCHGATEGEAEGTVWQFPPQEVAVLA